MVLLQNLNYPVMIKPFHNRHKGNLRVELIKIKNQSDRQSGMMMDLLPELLLYDPALLETFQMSQ